MVHFGPCSPSVVADLPLTSGTTVYIGGEMIWSLLEETAELYPGASDDATWVSERKALAGQWDVEKEKATVEEGRQPKAKGDMVPLHERWAKPKKEGLVKRIISARRAPTAERQREQDKEAWGDVAA